ncbi:MAG TPA: ABC transporter permease [Gemmatimonadaceae bacterium]|nr:ABC transporter permease [Gemmatimonadaceae bacterium]
MSDSSPSWRRYLRLRRSDVRADVDDELRFHLELRVADLIAAGMPPAAARAEAERRFGDVHEIGDACLTIDERRLRRADRLEVIAHMRQDLTLAARSLRKSPGFALTALLSIALGVGLTTTVFSAARAILIRPLPFERPDELVAVYARNTVWGVGGVNISYPDYLSWRDESRSLAGLAMWTWDSHTLSGGGGTADAERVEGAEVTADLFPLLGVRPLLGRAFEPGDETPGRHHVVLLSHGLWRRRYAGDPAIVGRAVTVDGRPYTVVGVMPPRFHFPERGQMWVPFSITPDARSRDNRYFAGAIGRMQPGVSLERARADLAAVSARLQKEYPGNVGWTADVVTMRDDLVGDLRRPLLVVLGAVGLVLLVACANVANLMLARGTARERELAVRAAIGAGRGRLVRQVLAESLLLAALGGAAGAALAAFGVRLFGRAFPNDVPYYISLGLDGGALAFALLLSALAAALCGLAPALRAGRVDPGVALREGGRGTTAAGRSRALMNHGPTLVVAEVALSIVLMVGAMLLVRSYANLQETELGFTERGLLTLRISLPSATYGPRERVGAYYTALLERVAALPGVESVGAAQGAPFSGWDVSASVAAEGRPPAPPGRELTSHYQFVTPEFFHALGVPVLRGRGLAATDRDSMALVGVVNESLVRTLFPNEDPLGKRVQIGGDTWVTVVGVVRDYRHYRLPQPMGPAIYLPFAATPPRTMALAVRAAGGVDPLALLPAVQAAMRAIDPDVPAYRVQTLEQVVSASLWRQRLQGQVLGAFAALALLMAAVGLYGVISYAVAQRTRELGVRIALGAGRGHVLALVLGQGARLALAGTAAGLAGALALSRVLSSLLYGVRPTDLATFVGVPAALVVVALGACYVPARRAAGVDPVVAMRGDG